MTHASWWREVWQAYPCSTCGAGPGDPCRSASGALMHEPHAPRARLAAEHHWINPDTEETDA